MTPFLMDVNEAVTEFREDDKWRDTMVTMEEKLKWAMEDARKEGFAEGKAKGMAEGKAEGKISNLVSQVCRKLSKGKDAATIADELEEDMSLVDLIITEAKPYASDYNIEAVTKAVLKRHHS